MSPGIRSLSVRYPDRTCCHKVEKIPVGYADQVNHRDLWREKDHIVATTRR